MLHFWLIFSSFSLTRTLFQSSGESLVLFLCFCILFYLFVHFCYCLFAFCIFPIFWMVLVAPIFLTFFHCFFCLTHPRFIVVSIFISIAFGVCCVVLLFSTVGGSLLLLFQLIALYFFVQRCSESFSETFWLLWKHSTSFMTILET